jgi:hypothetical protein
MQANHAVANRTFCIERVEPPSPHQLYKFEKPYGQTHGGFTLGFQTPAGAHSYACFMAPDANDRKKASFLTGRQCKPNRQNC